MIDYPYYYQPQLIEHVNETINTDVCIYGGTPAGVAAAIQVCRMGDRAVILEPGHHLGGMTSGGLGHTDVGSKDAIGGISREFYRRVGQCYGEPEEWNFEPHVAEKTFDAMAAEAKAPVYYGQFLRSVHKAGDRIVSITLESGLTVKARVFIDSSYEGDLMAKSGVKYTVGPEGNDRYGETLDGVQIHNGHQFKLPVDPYVVEGDPKSGLLPHICATEPAAEGTGDSRIQAYNFRLCLTKSPDNRIPFEKPAGYDPQEYVLLSRLFAQGYPIDQIFQKFDKIKNDKVDKNNHGPVSTDYIGANYDFPEADYATREKIYQAHVTYQKGLMWFLGNDPTVPADVRDEWNQWGLCKDEFQDTGGWPAQLYIREARRMVSSYVMTENNCTGKAVADDSIGLGSYNMDSHNCERFVQDGHVRNEGDVQIGVPSYPISYRAIVPDKPECQNLLVPVCLSATHIAYGSIRMEPVFMILGQSAGTAAVLAIADKKAVQDIPYPELRNRLLADGQVLSVGNLVP